MRNAIITGARRGIGRAIVEEFAKKGINIWACASCQDDKFEIDMHQMAKKYGVWIKPVYFNLGNEDEVKSELKKIIQEKKTIDILVNNAGIPSGGLMQMTSLNTLRNVMEINFIAQILVIQIVSKVMMRQKSGIIINMGSVGGIEAREGYLSYGSSKAAFIWATKCIAKELARYNIQVNAIAPGLIETDMGAYKSEEEREKIVNANAMKRLGTAEEIASVAGFLVSEAASFMTGTVLNVDGGRL